MQSDKSSNEIVQATLDKLGPYQYPSLQPGEEFGDMELRERTETDDYIYTGHWVGECREGRGHCIWKADGKVYEGHWKGDKPEGKGRMVYAKGAYYIGAFAEGKQNGDGISYFADKSIYKGDHVNNKKHGSGVHTLPDG
mgnify:CR=1 FL=1